MCSGDPHCGWEGTRSAPRLRRLVILSDVLLLLTAVLMFAGKGNALGLDWLVYVNYVKNNWVITLLVAAILQLYTTYRISSELDREAKKP